ncbi:hypothetical protein [Zobellia barbeyronii]|uniref:Uncharacterized protein n=1 Tax=Zobellia barbeyronii TaxID=2748009 RepID=A0ABS5W8A3_9FLAO|nr:hypothetical protein [Zobellia barbeyronii]MBT2159678.1 hypothetical protein [Zobellia barbeyronii]
MKYKTVSKRKKNVAIRKKHKYNQLNLNKLYDSQLKSSIPKAHFIQYEWVYEIYRSDNICEEIRPILRKGVIQ